MFRGIAVIILALSLCSGASAGEVIDRIVASVNNHPVLQSDWEEAVHFEAFLQGRAESAMTEAERRATLNRLIDQELLSQQMQADFSPSEEQVRERMKKVRAQVTGNASDAEWQRALAQYGLDETQLREKLSTQLQILRFVDLRLRPSARVDRDAIAEYYKDKLVPELKKSGAEPEPLEAVSGKIRELLSQQRMDELLTAWLANLRGQSAIRMMARQSVPAGPLMGRMVGTRK